MPVKIIIVHGLNNNLECFSPLKDKLTTCGYPCEIVCLPGHGVKRDETKVWATARESFNQSMERAINGEPYMVMAFSQGALYLQLWLEERQGPMPLGQVLLAPALFIRHFSKLNRIMSLLPSFLFIISQVPKRLRRYPFLYIWEYRLLFEKAKKFQELNSPLKVPTLILIDPKDELVDAQRIKKEFDRENSNTKVEFIERAHLKGKRPGKYHILFHPDYHLVEDWEKLIQRISSFIEEN